MDLTRTLLAVVGILVGLMAWSRVAMWTIGAWGLRKDRAAMMNPDTRSAAKIFFSLMGGWILVFGAVLSYLLVSTDLKRSGWVWFFGGMALTPFLTLMTFLFAYAESTAIESTAPGPSHLAKRSRNRCSTEAILLY